MRQLIIVILLLIKYNATYGSVGIKYYNAPINLWDLKSGSKTGSASNSFSSGFGIEVNVFTNSRISPSFSLNYFGIHLSTPEYVLPVSAGDSAMVFQRYRLSEIQLMSGVHIDILDWKKLKLVTMISLGVNPLVLIKTARTIEVETIYSTNNMNAGRVLPVLGKENSRDYSAMPTLIASAGIGAERVFAKKFTVGLSVRWTYSRLSDPTSGLREAVESKYYSLLSYTQSTIGICVRYSLRSAELN